MSDYIKNIRKKVGHDPLILTFVSGILTNDDNLSSETLKLKYFNKNNLPKIFNDQHRKSIKNFFDNKIPFYD
ncbi:MAG: hypothetical protein HDR41_02105 [Lactobacillus sp.]|nr:hypothetical protein [Lactobacillus sp.]